MTSGIIDLTQLAPDQLQHSPPKQGRAAKSPPSTASAAAAPPTTSAPTTTTSVLPDTVSAPPAPAPHSDEQKPADPDLPFLSISLPDEATVSVPVYDSCDELRRKIRAFFRNPKYSKVTQKRFCEAIGDVNPNTYRRFMEKKGETAGAESGMFYGSYVFFEKMRIWEGKPKGVRRVRSEAEFPHGRPMADDNRRGVWVIGRAPAKRGGGRRKGWY